MTKGAFSNQYVPVMLAVMVSLFACSPSDLISPGGVGTNPYKPTPCRVTSFQAGFDENIYNNQGILVKRIESRKLIYTYNYSGDSVVIHLTHEQENIKDRLEAVYKVNAKGEPVSFLKYRYFTANDGSPFVFGEFTKNYFDQGLVVASSTRYLTIVRLEGWDDNNTRDSLALQWDHVGDNIISYDYYRSEDNGKTYSQTFHADLTYDDKFNPYYGILMEFNRKDLHYSKNNVISTILTYPKDAVLPPYTTYSDMYTYNKTGLPLSKMSDGPPFRWPQYFTYENCR